MGVHFAGKLVMCLGDFNGHVGRYIYGYDGLHGGYGKVRVIWNKECYWSFVWRRNYVCQIHDLRESKIGR